jgi:hypothetical protein
MKIFLRCEETLPALLTTAAAEETTVDSIEECLADERLMCSSVEFALMLDEAGVEGIGQDCLERGHSYRLTTASHQTSGLEHSDDLAEGALPLGGQPKRLHNEGSRGRIDLDGPLCPHHDVLIAEWRLSWTLAGLDSRRHCLLGDLGTDVMIPLFKLGPSERGSWFK